MPLTSLEKKSKDPKDLQKHLKTIESSLSEGKAENIAIYDVRHKKIYCDFIIVATGNSTLHLRALYNKVKKKLKEEIFLPYNANKSVEENSWHILDYTDIVVHFFLQESRDYYKIDELFEKLQNDRENNAENSEKHSQT